MGKRDYRWVISFSYNCRWNLTTIIIEARKSLIRGWQATSKFAKAVYNLGKKLGGLIAPLISIVSNVISSGAKDIGWLANNLWLLLLAFLRFIYDQYKQRRK